MDSIKCSIRYSILDVFFIVLHKLFIMIFYFLTLFLIKTKLQMKCTSFFSTFFFKIQTKTHFDLLDRLRACALAAGSAIESIVGAMQGPEAGGQGAGVRLGHRAGPRLPQVRYPYQLTS